MNAVNCVACACGTKVVAILALHTHIVDKKVFELADHLGNDVMKNLSVERLAEIINKNYPDHTNIRLFSSYGSSSFQKLSKLTNKNVLSVDDVIYAPSKGKMSTPGNMHVSTPD